MSDNGASVTEDVLDRSVDADLETPSTEFVSVVSDTELLAYVKDALNRGEKFNNIANSLCMKRNVLSRRLKGIGWGGVYHSIELDELVHTIADHVPFLRGGSNWGMRTVAACLRSILGLRVPRAKVQDALLSLQPQHMQRRQVRALFRGQYNISEPMILWHMDCELQHLLAVLMYQSKIQVFVFTFCSSWDL